MINDTDEGLLTADTDQLVDGISECELRATAITHLGQDNVSIMTLSEVIAWHNNNI